MSDYGFNISPKKWIAISVFLIALGVIRRVTDSVLPELLYWAVIIGVLTAIWHWKPR